MAVFTAHTVVHRDSRPVFFAPGDEVPDWAVDRVGDHVIESGAKPEPRTDAKPDAKPGPDFTKPSAKSRRK